MILELTHFQQTTAAIVFLYMVGQIAYLYKELNITKKDLELYKRIEMQKEFRIETLSATIRRIEGDEE